MLHKNLYKVHLYLLGKDVNYMRTLAYKVSDQQLSPIGDHSNIVAGSKGYLKAKFEFNSEWDGCTKVASFFNNGNEYASILDTDESCEIPGEALTSNSFEVSVEGRKPGYRILSKRIKERQIGGMNNADG